MNTPSTISTIIPIHHAEAALAPTGAAAAPSQGCGACTHSAARPACQIERAPANSAHTAPQLSGPPQQLEALLHALEQTLLAPEPDAPPRAASASIHDLVRSLRLAEGEVELVLGVAPRCGGAYLADAAFQTLRRLLPDTDIYVRHAV